ncbi:hypothetical protein L0666_02625 [Octadecabacter sp. CECT 8868]|uniref:hypothetical protein n=1 Tax=Octadecabacter algicola TaxID=2909342 RepID=UPI001F2E2B54|nr:hypothetical protein [Octadecabacter algicola]MCF2903869.1 hypothetical protein [Octadecabacter algicola]
MFKTTPLLAACLFALAGCNLPPSATAPAVDGESAARVVQQQIKPGVRACIPYAQGGSLDTNILAQAGFTGPRSTLGRDTYDAANLFLTVNDANGRCRMTWNLAPNGTDATAALRSVLADAGYRDAGSDGNVVIFTNGSNNIGAQVIFTRSSTLTALDVILQRR